MIDFLSLFNWVKFLQSFALRQNFQSSSDRKLDMCTRPLFTSSYSKVNQGFKDTSVQVESSILTDDMIEYKLYNV